MAFNYVSNTKAIWKNKDKKLLLKLAGTMPIEILAKKFTDKTLGSVKAQCFRLGVKFGFTAND